MILQYAQLLSTAHRILDGVESLGFSKSGRKRKTFVLSNLIKNKELYAATHINHPCAVWTRMSHSNYYWLYTLWVFLLDEYTFRYDKIHACSKLKQLLQSVPTLIENRPFSYQPLAMPNEFKSNHCEDSYKRYYIYAKSKFTTWKRREVPNWFYKVIVIIDD
jgi:hypothetical protein